MKICSFFHLEEFIPKDTFEELQGKSILLLDNRIIAIADGIRSYFGKPMTINNWHIGGEFTQRGWRKHGLNGHNYSQHLWGRACDFHIEGYAASEIRGAISQHQDRFPLIRGMELDTTWVHVDCGNRPGKGITTFTA